MHVVVLGAGLAGLATAHELARAGVRTTVLERNFHVGGLAHSWRVGPFTLDTGPHRFHTRDEELVRHLYDVLDGDVVQRERKSRIYLEGKFFDYPLRLTNVLKGLPPGLLARALWDYLAIRVRQVAWPIPDDHFENWVLKRFGRTLYDLFFGTYTSKAWGMPCTEISADWAAQRISQANLWDAIVKTINPPREGEVRSLVTEFHYPGHGGVGRISEQYAEKARAAGADILLGSPLETIELDGLRARAVTFRTGGRPAGLAGERGARPGEGELERRECDAIVNTIPLPVAARALRPEVGADVRAAIEGLRYIAIVFVYLEVARPSVVPDHWVYLPSKDLTIHRLSEFKNFSDDAAPGDRTAVCCEITCRPGDHHYRLPLEDAAAIAEADLVRIGLLRPGESKPLDIVRLPHAYPVYDLEYAGRLETLRGAVSRVENLHTTGRQGLFRYNNMDHSIDMGRRVARTLVEGVDGRADQVAATREYFG